jgi:beta-phosphoglucomutase family hydrolase
VNSWAAIFDWDGVIIDSARHHEQSWKLLAAEEGLSLPVDQFKRRFGMKNEKIIPELLGWTRDTAEIRRLSLRKESLYREVMQAEGIAPLPGVAEWLEVLLASDVPCAIGSSTHRENIDCTLGVIGLKKYFRAIVSSEDVTHGKPDPEVFLLAARKLNITADRSVVFEDAHVGIEAAQRAGMKVVGVATTHPADSLVGADRVVHRLDELSALEFARWFDGTA